MSETSTTRKVQRLGGSSLIITLPKQWAKRLNIKVGDELQVVEDGGRLLVLPKDPGAEERANSVAIRYGSVARTVGASNIVSCAFEHGYSRLDIIIRGLQDSDVRRLEAELLADPRVASVDRETDRIVVRLLQPSDTDPSKALREAMGVLLDLLDAAERGDESEIRRLEASASDLMEVAIRLSKASEGLDPLAQGLLASIPHVLADAALLVKGRRDVIERLKEAVTELLGGIAGRSGRRLVNAAMIAAELRERALAEGPAMGALAVAADLLRHVSLKAVCPAVLEDQ